MRGVKITEEVYMRVKKQLKYHGQAEIARRNSLSIEKVKKIDLCPSYSHFEELTRAEHPPERESTLGKRVRELEGKFDKLARTVLPWEVW
jgi:hypothetical protein